MITALAHITAVCRPSRRCFMIATAQQTTAGRCSKLHIAVVGSGPSGFYAAKYLLQGRPDCRVDIIDRQPFPFGLVRYGIAPDHQDAKGAANTFKDIVAAFPGRIRFFGNVTVEDNGTTCSQQRTQPYTNIPLKALQASYDAVLLAHGASASKSLPIPNAGAEGIFSARDFASWYNGQPEYRDLGSRLHLDRVQHVVVIGLGNVAIDCVRLLAKINAVNTARWLQTQKQTSASQPESSGATLDGYDIPKHVMRVLESSRATQFTIIGRGSHLKASFTIKELRELSRLDDSALKIRMDELSRGKDTESLAWLANNRPKQRIADLMESIATKTLGPHAASQADSVTNHITIRFLQTPKAYLVDPKTGRVTGLVVSPTKTALTADSETLVDEEIPCQLVLESLGSKSEPLDGAPFDPTTHTVPHSKGRVSSASDSNDKINNDNLYVCGWAKRGPTGIIGTNIACAAETVKTLLEDFANTTDDSSHSNSISKAKADPVNCLDALRAPSVVSWDDAMALDAEEVRRAAVVDSSSAAPDNVDSSSTYPRRVKIREKFVNIREALAFLEVDRASRQKDAQNINLN